MTKKDQPHRICMYVCSLRVPKYKICTQKQKAKKNVRKNFPGIKKKQTGRDQTTKGKISKEGNVTFF